MKQKRLRSIAGDVIAMATNRNRWHLSGAILFVLMSFCLTATATLFDAWAYRMTLAFDRETGEALSDFPVLVELGEHLTGFEYAQFGSADGQDLRFATANEETELAYEIERWDTNGISTVWLRMPDLRGTGEVVNVYWGGNDATTPVYTTNGAVWVNGYRGVWHLSETNILAGQTGGTHFDSTTNAVNGSQLYNVSSNGVAGGGQYFNGSSAYIDFGNPDPVRINSDLTLSVWVKPEVLTGERGLLSKWSSSWCWVLQNGVNQIWFNAWRTATTAVPTNEWSQVAVVYDAAAQQIRLFVNGQLRGTHAQTTAPGTTADLLLGNRGGGGPSLFQGWMDEARIAAAARSDVWMETSYLTVASNDWFTTYSEALPQATKLTVVVGAVHDRGDTYATVIGAVAHAGEAENPDVYFCWGLTDGLTNAITDWENALAMGSAWGAGDSFSTNVTGLLSGTTYVYRAYATNSTGEAWSDARTFTTAALPAVTNAGPVWARRREALLEGQLLDAGFQSPKVWVEYWPESGPVTASVVIGTFDEQSFAVLLESLAPATEYQYRFAASNTAGIVWSAPDALTTLTDDPIGWYVATNGLETAGANWTTAFRSLSEAVDVAEPGDTIYMAGQTFWRADAVSLEARSGFSIYGSYAATNATDQPGPWDIDRWPTVLRRDHSMRTRLMDITDSTDLHFRAIRFQGGHPNHNQGGALRISGSTGLHFEHCHWFDNLAQRIVDHSAGSGGAAHVVNSTVTFDDCRFDANHTLGDSHHSRGLGGGLYLDNSTIGISNSFFSANRARTTGGNASYAYGYGGAIYLASGTLDVFRSVIHANDTMSGTGGGGMPTRGGGLYLAGGTARLENVLVATNATRSTNAQGCGLHVAGGTLHLLNVTVADNLREGIRRAAGTLTVTNSIVWHNGVWDILGQQNDFIAFTAIEAGQSDPAIAHGWQGCTTNAPAFVDHVYYHKASEHGCYVDGFFIGGSWSNAAVTCPLIDAGDPAMPVLYEPAPHGGLINLGAYGNTPVASKSAPMQVHNLAVTAWDETSVILNAQIGNVDSPPLQARFYYGLGNGGTDPGAWGDHVDAGEVPGWPWGISARIEGLTPGSTYYATCRIENDLGHHEWGTPVLSFTPERMLPVVENVGVLNDQGPSVTLRAEVLRPGSATPPPDVWFVWGPEPGGQSVDEWPNAVAMGSQTGMFETVMTTVAGSNYWFTSYAVNTEGTNWASAAIPFGHEIVRFVDTSATGNASGYNWLNAYTRLQDALAACVSDRTNVIYLKGGDGGTFRGTALEAITVSASHVRILGGCAGIVANGVGPRDPAQWPTVLTRESNVELVRPLLISGATDVSVKDVTLTDGDPRGSPGGGLRIQASSQVAIEACRIVSNKAYAAVDNSAGAGGGIAVLNSDGVTFNQVLVAQNDALGSSWHARGHGGGVYVENSSVTIRNSRLVANRARTTGGNSGYAWGFGGGLYLQSGTLQVETTVVATNTAEGGGQNMPTRGAGLYLAGGTARLRSTLIATNACTSSAAQGSGIHVAGGTLDVINVTVVDNRLEGIRRAAGTAAVTNSIIWGHSNGDLLNFPEDGGILTTVGYSLIGDGQNDGINGCISADPLFIDPAAGNYRLQTRYGRPGPLPDTWIHDPFTSPAIDAGTNLAWHQDALDLDGAPRRARGRFENQIAIVDMGAYEQISRPRGTLFLFR